MYIFTLYLKLYYILPNNWLYVKECTIFFKKLNKTNNNYYYYYYCIIIYSKLDKIII